MTRVNVSLPDEVLSQVDALASKMNCTRNDVLRKAAVRYVMNARENHVEGPHCDRGERIQKAIRASHELAEQLAEGADPAKLSPRRRRERDARL